MGFPSIVPNERSAEGPRPRHPEADSSPRDLVLSRDVTFYRFPVALFNVTIVATERGLFHACDSEDEERKKDLRER